MLRTEFDFDQIVSFVEGHREIFMRSSKLSRNSFITTWKSIDHVIIQVERTGVYKSSEKEKICRHISSSNQDMRVG